MSVKLTNDGDYLMCVLYNRYLERRKAGDTKDKARMMGSANDIFTKLLSEWRYEDVLETCNELSRAEMLKCFYADNTVYSSYLTDDAIVYMENRFMNNIDDLLNTISKLKSLIF